MSKLQKRHFAAVALLERLGLDYVRLEFRGGNRVVYRGWSMPAPVDTNGNSKTVTKHGWIKIPEAK
jgi:hypothetical protein